MVNQDYQVSACVPDELSEADRAACVAIIVEGGAVSAKSAASELPRARLLSIVRMGGNITGVGAIKRVRPDYARKIASRSGTEFPPKTPELGYVAIDAKHRSKGLSHRIVLSLATAQNGAMFATTSNERMKATLGKAGFRSKGHEWPGKREILSFWWKDDANLEGVG